MHSKSLGTALCFAGAMLISDGNASAQSLLDRSPNVSGDWVGSTGSLYFHFIHRFSTSGAPERKVTNVPTFLVAAGLPFHLLAGFNYSTNSTLAPRFPNEWEAFARLSPMSQDLGAPLDLGAQIGYNNAAQGVDGEVSAARRAGPLRVIAAGRILSDPFIAGHRRYAVAAGGTLRLGTYVALAADAGTLTSRDSTERVAWSAGLHVAIPMTPHTLSLQVTNTLVETLQGVSRGTNHLRYGFEFTIPLTLSRYFGRRSTESPTVDTTSQAIVSSPDAAPSVEAAAAPEPSPSPDTVKAAAAATPALPTTTSSPTSQRPARARPSLAATPSPKAAKTVRNGMKNINYLQGRLQIPVGTTVEWTNNDPLPHSVSAVDKSFNSGLIQPGKTFRHTFTRAGTFNYFCMPHPFMKGVVVVKE